MSRRSLKEHSCSSLPRFILDGDLKLCKIKKLIKNWAHFQKLNKRVRL